jgi:hypothetical protein
MPRLSYTFPKSGLVRVGMVEICCQVIYFKNVAGVNDSLSYIAVLDGE